MPPLAKESGVFAKARGLRLEEARGGKRLAACGERKRGLRRSEGPAAGRSKRRQKICRLWRKEAGLCRSGRPAAGRSKRRQKICRLWWKKAGFRRSERLRLEEAKGGNEICRLCGRNLIKLAEYKEDGHPCKCLEKCGRPCRKFYDKIHTTVAWIML